MEILPSITLVEVVASGSVLSGRFDTTASRLLSRGVTRRRS
jgi:hypothetical protein